MFDSGVEVFDVFAYDDEVDPSPGGCDVWPASCWANVGVHFEHFADGDVCGFSAATNLGSEWSFEDEFDSFDFVECFVGDSGGVACGEHFFAGVAFDEPKGDPCCFEYFAGCADDFGADSVAVDEYYFAHVFAFLSGWRLWSVLLSLVPPIVLVFVLFGVCCCWGFGFSGLFLFQSGCCRVLSRAGLLVLGHCL